MDDYFQSTAGVTARPVAVPGGSQASYPMPPAPDAWAQPAQPAATQPLAPQPWPPAWNGQAPAGMSTGTKVAIAVACAVGGLVILGILAAIAIPVFLDQRAKAAAAGITVTIPETIGGYDRLHDASATALERQLLSPDTPGHGTAAVYGTNGHIAASVSIWTHPMTSRARAQFLAGAERGAATQGDGKLSAFTDADPGSLGGQMRCAQLSNVVTLCMFADAGAYGSLMVGQPLTSGAAFAVQMREAVEHRR